jgi:Dyp-type peroxidase family
VRDDGRRAALFPALLREPVSLATAIERLDDVQCNILRKHGRRFAAHIFLKFNQPRIDEIKTWMAGFAATQLPNCSDQLAGRLASRPIAMLLLSAAGYRALGIEPPEGVSFRGGMKNANLNDPPVATWDEVFRHGLDALVLIADDDGNRLSAAVAAVETIAEHMEVFDIEHGADLPGGIEHFGFVDGISQPLFIQEEIIEARSQHADSLLWDPETPLWVVLARDPHGRSEDSYGSYFVFRKLEQDVARFEQGVRGLAERAQVSEAVAGAMTVGRFKDGTPLSLNPASGLGSVNNFNYNDDWEGRKCPFASHIRRVNPRGELDYVAHTPDWQNRIARRGIPYGSPGDSRVGLLFMCFQSDIGGQFELIQNNWCNFPHFPVLHTGKDPLVGQPNSWDHCEGQRWSSPQEEGDPTIFDFPQCVTMRGGEYFFAPSLSFLRGLDLR